METHGSEIPVNMTTDINNAHAGHKVTLYITCMAMYSIALAIGSVFLFLLIILRDEIRKVHTNWCILSGVIGLFFTAIWWLPLSLTNLTDWELGLGGCHLMQIVYHLLKIQLSLTMVIIAIDRCLFVYNPTAYQKSPSGRFTTYMIVTSWVIAAILAITLTYGMSFPRVIQRRDKVRVCVSSPRGGTTSRLASLFIEHFLPLLLNVIFATCLCCCQRNPDNDDSVEYKTKEARKLVWLPLVLFMLTCTPLFVVRFSEAVGGFHLEQKVWSILYSISELFYGALLVAWVALSPNVWPAIHSVCCCCCARPPEESKRLLELK